MRLTFSSNYVVLNEEIIMLCDSFTISSIFGLGAGSINMTHPAPVYFGNNAFDFINVNDIPPFSPELSPNLNPDPLPNRTDIVVEGTDAFKAFGTVSTPAGSGILAGESINPDFAALVDLRSFGENGIIRDLILPTTFILNNVTLWGSTISSLGERFITWDVDGNGEYGNRGDVFFSFHTLTKNIQGSQVLLDLEGGLGLIDPDGSIVAAYKADNSLSDHSIVETIIPSSIGLLSIQTDGVADLDNLGVFISVDEFNSVDLSNPEDIATGTMASAINAEAYLAIADIFCNGETAHINNVTVRPVSKGA